MKEIDNLKIRKEKLKKSHTIIAFNLQTVDDVDLIIRQCEALRKQMTDGLKTEISESVNSFDGKLT